MKIYRIVALMFIITACQNKYNDNAVVINNFPENKLINGKIIKMNNMPLMTNRIQIIDRFLIIPNIKDFDKPIFNIYNKNTYEFITSFGNKGGGPNEFLSPQLIVITGQYEIINNDICMWIKDQAHCKLINLTKSIQLNKTVLEKKIKIPKTITIPRDILILKNEKLFGTSMSPEGRFFTYDSKTKQTSWIEYFPKDSNPSISENQRLELYLGATRYNTNNNIIVSALMLFKRIDIFNEDAELQYSLKFEDSPVNHSFKNNKRSPKLIYYYREVYASKNKIYALNMNISEEQILNREMGTPEIHVFSIDGNPLCNYKLDRVLGSFTVNEEKGLLIGLAFSNDEFQVVEYKL